MSQNQTTPDILDRLHDLHKQATEERSHYYTGACVRDAITEIEKLRAAIHGVLTWVEKRPTPHPYDTWRAARRAVGLPDA